MPSVNSVHDAAYTAVAKAQADAAKDTAQNQMLWELAILAANELLKRTAAGFQAELADWQMDMAEDIQAHWEKFLPYERQLLQDIFAIPKYSPLYQALADQYGSIVIDSFWANHDDYMDFLDTVCSDKSDFCSDVRWKNEMALAEADFKSYACRVEEQREQALNDLRYAWRYAVLGLGRGILPDLVSFSKVIGQSADGSDLWQGLMRLGANIVNFKPPPAQIPWQGPVVTSTAQYGFTMEPARAGVPPKPVPTQTSIEEELPALSGEAY